MARRRRGSVLGRIKRTMGSPPLDAARGKGFGAGSSYRECPGPNQTALVRVRGTLTGRWRGSAAGSTGTGGSRSGEGGATSAAGGTRSDEGGVGSESGAAGVRSAEVGAGSEGCDATGPVFR